MNKTFLGLDRRSFLSGGSAVVAGSMFARRAMANWSPSLRYPDPSVEVLDPSFTKYRIFNSTVERLATGFRWLEGPVWIGDARYLLVSDIPNNQIIRWDEITGQTTIFRNDAGYPNGNVRDREGRLVTCEGGRRRVTRTEHDGSYTVLADSFEGKKLNSPNDVITHPDGSIWFTDPPFQISNNYEGILAEQELSFQGVFRVSSDGSLTLVIDDLAGPNGLAFTQDGKTLYVVEGRATPDRTVWAYNVGEDGNVSNKRRHITGENYGALDGLACDVDGNLWCGWGSTGVPEANSEVLDGVMVFNPSGEAIGHIRLPERAANVCFGGQHGNRLFIAGSHSIYSVHVNTRGVGLMYNE